MPVTARLSRKFYDRFGDDIVDELVDWFNQLDATYRTDLRELNELNFARFDAKLEQRLAHQDAHWEQRFAQMEVNWEQRFAQLEVNWERRLAKLEVVLSRRFYAVTVASALAQLTALLAILKFTGLR